MVSHKTQLKISSSHVHGSPIFVFFFFKLSAYNYSYIIGNLCVVLQRFSNFLQIYDNESSKFKYVPL